MRSVTDELVDEEARGVAVVEDRRVAECLVLDVVGFFRGEQIEELLRLVERGVEVAADLLALLLRVVAQQQRRATGAHALQRLRCGLLQHRLQLLDFST
jgi:hypothetical protein